MNNIKKYNMQVFKRNGKNQEVSFDKVKNRIKYLCSGLNIDPIIIAQKVCSRIYDGVKTSELDELAAQICTSMCTENIEYGVLGSRIIISNSHKNTSPSFSEKIYVLYHHKDIHGEHSPLIAKDVYEVVMNNKEKLNDVIDYQRDYNFNYFSYKTLERAYLMKKNGKIIERIQDVFMRVSVGLHKDNIKEAIQSYDMMSNKYFTHATPTLFHSGTPRPQLLSCFLLGTDDSIDGIYKNITDCAKISKWAGGIGIHVSNIRSKNTCIRGTNGISSGIIPMLKVYNETAKYVNQSGKRNGSIAVYLEPHHPDIMDFLQLRKNHGNEEERARDLFLAVWLSDLFMKRVKENKTWSLMDPDECRGLNDVYGEDFNKLYQEYEDKKMYKSQVPAQQIWKGIIESQIETGTPYILFKDHCNRKSNQKNIGTIKSSNLCSEILEYSDDKEYACCTLASIGLSKFVNYKPGVFKIYGKTSCKYCRMSKSVLSSIDEYKDFEYVSLDNDDVRQHFYKEMSDKQNIEINKVPQIYFNDQYIGGYDNLIEFLKNNKFFNFDKLEKVVSIAVRNLNKVIDLNYYPVPETELSNKRHRPLGLGVQGLADAYILMRYPFDSPEAMDLNKKIFETIYYAGLKTSCQMAKEEGAYSTFQGSPLSNGQFQFDLWGVEKTDRHHWDALRQDIIENGVRNSLLLALMPTASTSQILGNNECFEPYTSNIYTRRTIAGDFVIVNNHLIKDLTDINMWDNDLKNMIIANNGSVQNIDGIPENIKALYKTAWEIKQKVIIQQSIDRGPYICQTQSLNLFFEEPNYKLLSSALFYGWSKGLKTGSYYIRSRPKVQAQQFTIDPTLKSSEKTIDTTNRYDLENPSVCESCSS
jgi:ribonucleoside-diphosphate reductase alpha subunit